MSFVVQWTCPVHATHLSTSAIRYTPSALDTLAGRTGSRAKTGEGPMEPDRGVIVCELSIAGETDRIHADEVHVVGVTVPADSV